jgi:hypothetical protein
VGPKKGKKKGGKKKKGGGMGDDVDPMERNFILQAEGIAHHEAHSPARRCKPR